MLSTNRHGIAFLLLLFLPAVLVAATPASLSRNGLVSPVAGAPTAVENSSVSQETGLDETQRQAVIRAAYERLERFATGTGATLTLSVSGIETFAASRFTRLRWLDLVDLPEGHVIQTVRKLHHRHVLVPGKAQLDIASVFYVPSWLEAESNWRQLPWGAEIDRMSVAQVLNGASAKKGLGRVSAISAYTVTVSMGGETRVYRAAFLWIRTAEGSTPKFMIADNIVQNVEAAVQEALPPFVSEHGPARLKASRNLHLNKDEASSCTPQTATFQGSNQASSADDHLWGNHSSQSGFTITCTCSSDCSQVCSGAINGGTCGDSGFTIMYLHLMGTAQSTSSASSSVGDQVAASCAAGFGCVEKNCFLGLCGAVTIGVSATGPSVSFTPGGSPDWTGNGQFSQTCPLCQKVQPPPDGGGGDGGGGGGGGDGSCQEGDWVTPEQCVDECGGEVDELAGACYVD